MKHPTALLYVALDGGITDRMRESVNAGCGTGFILRPANPDYVETCGGLRCTAPAALF